jgi:hypothetical protein
MFVPFFIEDRYYPKSFCLNDTQHLASIMVIGVVKNSGNVKRSQTDPFIINQDPFVINQFLTPLKYEKKVF